MKLYDKKFLIYGNCMIRSFGQPGIVIIMIIFRTFEENVGFFFAGWMFLYHG